jgi:hypothetical protein
MSERQIIEQIASLIRECLPLADDPMWDATARAAARRVVQGLGLHEEDTYGARRSMFAPEGCTRYVTDWQEDQQ